MISTLQKMRFSPHVYLREIINSACSAIISFYLTMVESLNTNVKFEDFLESPWTYLWRRERKLFSLYGLLVLLFLTLDLFYWVFAIWYPTHAWTMVSHTIFNITWIFLTGACLFIPELYSYVTFIIGISAILLIETLGVAYCFFAGNLVALAVICLCILPIFVLFIAILVFLKDLYLPFKPNEDIQILETGPLDYNLFILHAVTSVTLVIWTSLASHNPKPIHWFAIIVNPATFALSALIVHSNSLHTALNVSNDSLLGSYCATMFTGTMLILQTILVDPFGVVPFVLVVVTLVLNSLALLGKNNQFQNTLAIGVKHIVEMAPTRVEMSPVNINKDISSSEIA